MQHLITIDWRDAKGRFAGTEEVVFSSRELAERWAESAKSTAIPRAQGYKPEYRECVVIDDAVDFERYDSYNSPA